MKNILLCIILVASAVRSDCTEGAGLELTLTGSTELTSSPMPYVVSFDLNTLTGTRTVTYWPNGTVGFILASDLAVTNFSAVLDGVPFASLSSATGRFAGDSLAGPGQFFEPLLSVNNVFGWDFLSPTTINQGTSDPVAALILGHEGAGISGYLGNNIISFKTLSIEVEHNPPSNVPEPGTLPLLAAALAALLAWRARRWGRIARRITEA